MATQLGQYDFGHCTKGGRSQSQQILKTTDIIKAKYTVNGEHS